MVEQSNQVPYQQVTCAARMPAKPSDSKWVPEVLFGLGLLSSIALLVAAGSGLTFNYDEWDVLLNRQGYSPESFLAPHNGQILVIPVVLYKLLLAGFGMGSQLPYRLCAVALSAVCVSLLFLFARPKVGSWLALASVTPVLFLGAGWEDLLWPLSISFTASLAFGMGMLLVLDRQESAKPSVEGESTRSTDALASVLLLLSVASGGLGIAFAAGAVVDALVRRELPRLWIPAIAVALAGLWAIVFGGDAASRFAPSEVAALPVYLFESAIAVLGAISGFSGGLLIVPFAIAIVARFVCSPVQVSRSAFVVGTTLLALWVMTGLTEDRIADANRYMYPGAVLLIAFMAALLDGVRLPRLLPLFLLPLIIFSVWTGIGLILEGRKDLAERSIITRSALHALDASREDNLANVRLGPELSGYEFLRFITPENYFRARDLYGSPAFSDRQLGLAGDVATGISEAVMVGLDKANGQAKWTRAVQREPKWPTFP